VTAWCLLLHDAVKTGTWLADAKLELEELHSECASKGEHGIACMCDRGGDKLTITSCKSVWSSTRTESVLPEAPLSG
jgi:hypothetical protein